jgi:hypothetical protein
MHQLPLTLGKVGHFSTGPNFTWNTHDWVAVEAVRREPVSRAISLITP